jgi:D-arabinose 1-dehydrogenase-like Zn-dependent alcohol dehydrogenase
MMKILLAVFGVPLAIIVVLAAVIVCRGITWWNSVKDKKTEL